MSEESDAQLLALFAHAHETLPDAQFMDAFWNQMARARRTRTLQRGLVLAGGAILAAWFLPSVLHSTATAMQVVGDYSESFSALLVSPAGWAVSTLIALGVLVRTRALRIR
jgi:hypothetical protein